MATYAGFKPYEVPSLGDIMAKGIDKRAMLDYKESVLKAKQENDALKAANKKAENDAKQAQKDKKESDKTLATQLSDIEKGFGEVQQAKASSTSLAEFGVRIAEDIKNNTKQFLGSSENKLTTPEQAMFVTSTTNSLKSLKGLEDDIPKIENPKSDSPYANYSCKTAIGMFPTTNNPVIGEVKNGNIYAQQLEIDPDIDPMKFGYAVPQLRPKGEPIDLQYIRTASKLSESKAPNFGSEIDEVMKYGRQENTPGYVDQKSNKKYQEQRDQYANKISNSNDAQQLTDAYVHFMKEKDVTVVLAGVGETEEDIKKRVLSTYGIDDEKKYDVLRMKYDNGQIVPAMTKAQRASLKSNIIETCDARAEKKLPTPKEGKQPKVTDDIVNSILAGNENAMAAWATVASNRSRAAKVNIPVPGVPGANMSKGYYYDDEHKKLWYLPKNLGPDQSSKDPTVDLEYIDLNDKKTARFTLEKFAQ